MAVDIHSQSATQHTQAQTTPAQSSAEYLSNERHQQPQAPQPAPRTRLSSQNSVPLTNGDAKSEKSDEAVQVRPRDEFIYE